MDGMIQEIIHVLERCSKPETTVSDEERADNEYLIDRVEIFNVAIELSEKKGHDALLLLFRNARDLQLRTI
jgi:hypothetical protein